MPTAPAFIQGPSFPSQVVPERLDEDAAVGVSVRECLGARIPWVAVQTSFSALHGTVSAARWGAALGALNGGAAPVAADRRGANHPADGAAVHLAAQASVAALAGASIPMLPSKPVAAPTGSAPWAALADLGDLAGVPACLSEWGHGRVAMGATLPLADDGHGPPPVLLLAPNEPAYRRLCRLLSWHHEAPDEWTAWVVGLTEVGPAWDGLIALVQDLRWAERLRWYGAEVYWRRPGPAAPPGWIEVALPILTDISGSGRKAASILHMIQDRSQVAAHIEAVRGRVASCTLAALPKAMAGIDDQAIARGHDLAARCLFSPGRPDENGQPRWQMPPSRWEDPARELRQRCLAGLHQRYGGAPPAGLRDRLEYELGIITRKNFCTYILTVQHLAKGRRTCGRGSAASSLVCYLLALTNVDPLKYRLVFERFLNDARTDPPDIDIDFPWDERDLVFTEAFHEYGREYVAMVATHQTMRRGGAMREASRVLGHERSEVTAAMHRMDLVDRYGVGEGAGERWHGVLEAAGEITGTIRGYGLHCGGMVITTEPIRDYVPVHPAAKRIDQIPVPCIAWEKNGTEEMGLVKIDILGNRSLAVVRDVLADLREDGIAVDEWRWAPDDDLLARKLVREGQTIGCFCIESPAMRLLNAKCGDVDFDRLVLNSSIVRPAAHHWINVYLKRLHEYRKTGKHDPAWYPHPALGTLLSEGFGILSYQEDVMLSARDMAGFGQRDQDKLRKALGRSDTPQRLAHLAKAFFEGCKARGVTDEATRTVWSMIVSFAGYSFCKAHSASYAMVSYACAALKAHNPAHFLARVLHNEGGFYSRTAYVEEARRIGVAILPPCVVHGHPDTRREGHGAIRLGFEMIRGLHKRTQEAIISERCRTPFASVRDLRRRCRPTSAEVISLLDAGALAMLMPTRTAAERDWIAHQVAGEPITDGDDDEQLRFDFAPVVTEDPAPCAGLAEVPQRALDQRAWNMLGCLPRAHPFALWDLPKANMRCKEIGPHLEGRTLAILAWVITRKQVDAVQERGRDGSTLPEALIRPMAFGTLEDESGTAEATWFPDVYRACGPLIERGEPCWIQGRVAVDFGVTTLEITAAWAVTVPNDRARQRHGGQLKSMG